MTPLLQEAFLQGHSMQALEKIARDAGWVSLVNRCQDYITQGITDDAEGRRVCGYK